MWEAHKGIHNKCKWEEVVRAWPGLASHLPPPTVHSPNQCPGPSLLTVLPSSRLRQAVLSLAADELHARVQLLSGAAKVLMNMSACHRGTLLTSPVPLTSPSQTGRPTPSCSCLLGGVATGPGLGGQYPLLGATLGQHRRQSPGPWWHREAAGSGPVLASPTPRLPRLCAPGLRVQEGATWLLLSPCSDLRPLAAGPVGFPEPSGLLWAHGASKCKGVCSGRGQRLPRQDQDDPWLLLTAEYSSARSWAFCLPAALCLSLRPAGGMGGEMAGARGGSRALGD